MSTGTSPIRLPVLPLVLAALLLLLSAGLLLLGHIDQSVKSNNRQSTQDLMVSVDQLSTVVNTDTATWVQSEQLARLVASVDMQIGRLTESSEGIYGFLSSGINTDSLQRVSADWQQLRQGLVSLNQASWNQNSSTEPQSAVVVNEVVPEPVAEKPDTQTINAQQSLVVEEMRSLAREFAVLSDSVIEGTRVQPLIDLINTVSAGWAQIDNPDVEVAVLVVQQQAYSAELLRLSGVGTQNALFGFYTNSRITDYVQKLERIQVPEQAVQTNPTPSPTPVTAEEQVATESPVVNNEAEAEFLNTDFVFEALASLQQSVAVLYDFDSNRAKNLGLVNQLGLAGLAVSLLLLLSALLDMFRASARIKEQAYAQANAPAPEVNAGAISLREADQIIEVIEAVADGDLRETVRLPEQGHAKVIAATANRSGKVIRDLVEMTRGVATRLDSLVQNQDQHTRILAELDVRRQTETAELSDSISLRSGYLNHQRALLSGSHALTAEIEKRSEKAANGVNQVSASIASMSAQVDIGAERMQRLLKTTDTVTEVVGRLKELTEKTRLQALNMSLKIPAVSHETATDVGQSDYFAYSSSASESVGDRPDDTEGLFDGIHHLTAGLVQASNEANSLIGGLQKDMLDTALALKQSSEGINEGAHHTLSTSLLGKELAGYADKLHEIVAEALKSVELQQTELSQSAEQIVQLDKTGNAYSELAVTLSHDIAGLQEMSSRLEDSVSGFKTGGEAALE